jgi:NADH-quinone oxidoreductase subunit A
MTCTMPYPAYLLAEGGVSLLQVMAIFAAGAFLMGFAALLIGRFIRRQRNNPDKQAAYECGEVPIGEGWVQFDLRFYVVALVFLIFDVEIALFWPWAVVYGGGTAGANPGWEVLRSIRWAALWDMLFFFGVIVVGFLYLWRFGYLDWVRLVSSRQEEHTIAEIAPQAMLQTSVVAKEAAQPAAKPLAEG